MLRFLKKPLRAKISFSEFLDFLEFGEGTNVNYHWARQVDLLALSKDNLLFLGKVENLKNDLELITQEIFGEKQKIVNWHPHATSKGSEIEVDIREKERIFKLYEDDFKAFKYDLP